MNKGHFSVVAGATAPDNKYGSTMQSDGHSWLCPNCGGYCKVPNGACEYCKGKGELPLTDSRIRRESVNGQNTARPTG